MHVFFSHSNKEPDKTITQNLVKSLSGKGVFCWADFQDLHMGDWAQQIEKARRTASVYVFVASKNSLQSEECIKELVNISAGSNRERLIPFFIDDFYFKNQEIKDKYHYQVGSLQGVSLEKFSSEEDAFFAVYQLLPKDLTMENQDLTAFEFSSDMGTVTKYNGNADCLKISGVSAIGERAFLGNKSLHKIILPSTVKSIGKFAFCDCENLDFAEGGEGLIECASGVVGFDVPAVMKVDGVYVFMTVAIGAEEEKNSLVIPEGVRVIANNAFKNRFDLEKVTLPSTLVSIGANAFKGCVRLKEINLTEGVAIGKNAFEDCALETE